MADLSQVSAALVALVAGRLYPGGTGAPSIVAAPVIVYAGWPRPGSLEADLPAGKVHVSVWATDSVRSDIRPPVWREQSIQPATMAGIASGQSVAIAGTATPGHSVALLVDGRPYVVPTPAGSTPATVAAALAALIAADQPASAAGAVLTIPQARSIKARTVSTGTAARTVLRETRTYQVTAWAGDSRLRDAVGAGVHVALAATARLALPDSTIGTVSVLSSRNDDDLTRQAIYRRDTMVSVVSDVIEGQTQYTVAIPATRSSSGPTFDAQGPARTTYE